MQPEFWVSAFFFTVITTRYVRQIQQGTARVWVSAFSLLLQLGVCVKSNKVQPGFWVSAAFSLSLQLGLRQILQGTARVLSICLFIVITARCVRQIQQGTARGLGICLFTVISAKTVRQIQQGAARGLGIRLFTVITN